MLRIIFVCLGNICRSPMAEAVCRDLINREGIERQVEIDSAGTGHWHVGKSPHEGTRHILDEHGIDSHGIKARLFTTSDWFAFDYIIGMDAHNLADLEVYRPADSGKVTVARLMDFVQNPAKKDVPDPYFTGNFEETYSLVQAGCRQLIHHIKAKHEI